MPRKPAPRCKHCRVPLEIGPRPGVHGIQVWMHRHAGRLYLFCQMPTPKSGNPLRAEPKEEK